MGQEEELQEAREGVEITVGRRSRRSRGRSSLYEVMVELRGSEEVIRGGVRSNEQLQGHDSGVKENPI